MNNKDILKFINDSEDKDFLLKLRDAVTTKIAYIKYGIGDTINITIEYMIGDANGDTNETTVYRIDDENAFKALTIIKDILDNHTSPNQGTWGFIMDYENFSTKPEQVYYVLYGDEDDDEDVVTEYITTSGEVIELNEKIISNIRSIEEDLFRGETSYSFLVYRGYDIEVV